MKLLVAVMTLGLAGIQQSVLAQVDSSSPTAKMAAAVIKAVDLAGWAVRQAK